MRTTVDLDEDVLQAVRSLARLQRRTFGAVLSDLARRSLRPAVVIDEGPGGFPVFTPPAGADPLTLETVRAALDEE